MARPARFSEDDVLDAAGRGLARHGPNVTLVQVAMQLQGPTGSIYHRFPSREHLMVRLWLRSIGRFHVGLLEAYAQADPQEALLAATLHIPRFCREQPLDALAMTLYRQPVLASEAPDDLRAAVRHVNDEVDERLRELASRRFGEHVDAGFRFAMVGTRSCPYGLVRPLVGGIIPGWMDEVCVAAAKGILALGDQ